MSSIFLLILWSFKLIFHRWTPFAPGIHYLIYFRNQAQDPQIEPIHTLTMQGNTKQRSLLSCSSPLPAGNHFCGCCAPRTAIRVYREPLSFPVPPCNISFPSVNKKRKKKSHQERWVESKKTWYKNLEINDETFGFRYFRARFYQLSIPPDRICPQIYIIYLKGHSSI